MIDSVAQSIITAVDLAKWPYDQRFDGICGKIFVIPYTAFEKMTNVFDELVLRPFLNLVLAIPAALIGVACAWLAAPWGRHWGVVRIGTSSQSLRFAVGVATVAAVALGVVQVVTANTDPRRDIYYDPDRHLHRRLLHPYMCADP